MHNDLQEYIRYLYKKGRLIEVDERVSPELQITAFTDAACRHGAADRSGKALLFNSVEGSEMPVVTNLFASASSMEELFSGTYAREMLGQMVRMKSGGAKLSLVKGAKLLLDSKPKLIPSQLGKYVRLGSLDDLPVLKVWPKDAGRFITLPLVITRSPNDGSTNVGVYRMQVFDGHTTGMHWQAQKGGAMHAHEAGKKGQKLNVAVVVGTDPHNIVSAVAPLPAGINEFFFSGAVRGSRTVLMRNGKYPDVPANSEIIINGTVDPNEKRMEGPFGDHTGYYSIPEEYPVFHIDEIYARKKPLYAASIVGHPWHEDTVMAQFLFEFFKPAILALNESIIDVYLPPEGVFTNMCFVSVSKRFPGEAKKAMFSILGTGQLSFTKIIIAFDGDVDIRNNSSVLWALATRVEPQRDVQIIANAAADSLDHTTDLPSYGSKMLIDATKKTKGEGYSREWPDTVALPEELKKEVERKWASLGK
jgi:4-hydroxy-3-polyprenylbenzoate decarboxylase